MKNLLLIAVAMLVSGVLYFSLSQQESKEELSPALGLAPHIAAQTPEGLIEAQKADRERRLNRPEGVQGFAKARAYLHEMRKDPATGDIPQDVVLASRQIANQKLREKSALDIEWEELGPNNIGGRTRSLIIDKDDPQKLIAGSVAGGVWLSDNGGTNWRQAESNATMESIAIGCMVQAADGKIYAGTGEWFYFLGGDGSGGFSGEGIFVSEDGGNTFTQTNAKPASSNLGSGDWTAVNRMTAHPSENIVFAATSRGLFRSTDGFQSFDKMIDTNSTGASYDVHYAANGRLHAFLGTRYYYSDNDGDDWTENSGSEGIPVLSGRATVKSAPSDPNIVYVVTIQGGCLKGFYQSKDGGESYTLITGGGSDYFQPMANGVQCQGDYDLALGVADWDPERVFVGGVSLWTWSQSSAWYQIDGGSPPYNVHADKHDVIMDTSSPGTFYVIHDGGITKTTNGQDTYPAFTTINKNFNVTQYYGMDAGHDGQVLGGTQDNGTHLINFYNPINSNQAAESVNGGDGGNAEISHIKPNIMFAATPNGDLVRSGNFGQSFGGFLDCTVDYDPPSGQAPNQVCGGDGLFDDAEQFVNPFLLWEDLELYYNLYDAQAGDEFDPADSDYPFSYHNNKFIVTTNEIFVSDKPIEMFEDGEDIYLLADSETGVLIDRRIIRARYYTGTGGNGSQAFGEVWMNSTPLDLVNNDWIKIGQISGSSQTVTCFAASKDGSRVYVGSSRGKVLRVNGLNNYTERFDDLGNSLGFGPNAEEILAGSEDVTLAANRNIRGLAIHPSNPQKLFASATSYGASTYVYYSDNALGDMDFVSIQEDLPEMPVYDLTIASKGLQRILIAGTEMGIWAYELTSNVTGGTWTNESGILNNIQVFDVDIEPMGAVDARAGLECDVLYVATHGRGMFRTTSFAKNGCEENVQLPTFNVNTDNEDIQAGVPSLTVYPNPATANSTVDFAITKRTAATLKVYAPNAQCLIDKNLGNLTPGTYSENIDVSDLPAGQYFVVLRTELGNSTSSLIVAR